MRHRSRYIVALGALAGSSLVAQEARPARTSLQVVLVGLRSARGQVLACATRRPEAFPDCQRDPTAVARRMPANAAAVIDFGFLPEGRYAVAVIHDENGNGRLDRALGLIPREGFGFSRDAPIRAGPPHFASAAFHLGGAAPQRMAIRLRYLL